jgi:RNase P/RNase MRP subunit p29
MPSPNPTLETEPIFPSSMRHELYGLKAELAAENNSDGIKGLIFHATKTISHSYAS